MANMAKPKALVTNENALERSLAAMALQRAGFDTLEAANAIQTISIMHQTPVDLLLLDILLPYGNGLDLLQYLKANGNLNRTAAFIISELAFPEIVQQAAEAGARGFLAKPLDVDLLLARVQKIFPVIRAPEYEQHPAN